MDRESAKITAIKDGVVNDLKYWGVEEKNILVESNHSHYFKRETIDAQKDNVFFRITLYAQLKSKEESVGFQWEVSIIFFCENKYNILLSIGLENIESKVKKWFGKRDLETYNEAFDKAFLIEGNHNYAHVNLLDQDLQNKLLKVQQDFNKLSLTKDCIRYKEYLGIAIWDDPCNRIKNLLDIGFHLTQNLNKWTPPKA